MADDEKLIHVDDDWKAQARKEKEQLADRADVQREAMPDASFAGLVDLLAMQALVSLGGMTGPGGERYTPQPEAAKHFIDMLQVLEDKTKGNLSEEEKKLMDTVLYEVRMRYVQSVSGGSMPPGV